jgi:hypothetical protein
MSEITAQKREHEELLQLRKQISEIRARSIRDVKHDGSLSRAVDKC